MFINGYSNPRRGSDAIIVFGFPCRFPTRQDEREFAYLVIEVNLISRADPVGFGLVAGL